MTAIGSTIAVGTEVPARFRFRFRTLTLTLTLALIHTSSIPHDNKRHK
ncbi:hypothetical protein GCM10010390_34790 [Streptomyces mordarskii]|uniref:Uncharacterized protein n=1 Tax=Streptomyces mordarskii TaxID=1226758 RepID=A0ABN1CYL4_9ACTN